MPLKTFVKVGRITNLSDARYCAGMGVDMLGFRTMEGQENYIKPSKFQEIRGWITGPLVVAEVYGLKDPDLITQILEDFKPDFLEMGMQELSLFSTLPLPLLLAVNERDDLSNLSVSPAYLICQRPFQSSLPQLIEVQEKSELEGVLHDSKIIGIVLKGGTEVRPGLKDYEGLNEILELLEEEG
jgi:phosphoribosylanthranilate isomerase